jgi:dTDP-glucose pyrophosphorylase
MEKEIAIVFMVAGVSSRFGGKIKQFAMVTENETFIEFSLNQALKAGFNKIVFVVGNKTEQVFKEKFGNSYKNIPIQYALQTYDSEVRDRPWGTGDAACSIKNIINCPFVICNGDDIYGEKTFQTLYNHLQENNEEATIGYKLIETLPDTCKRNMGIFQIKDNYVQSMEEVYNIDKFDLKATNSNPDDLSSMNIYALHPEIIHLMNRKLELFKEQHRNDRKAEALIQHLLTSLIQENKMKMKIYPSSEKTFGITKPGDEEVAKNIIKETENKKTEQKKQIAIAFMVAGISSRFEGKIKQFEKISDDKTLIEYSLDQALKAGFDKIVFIVGNKTERPFKDFFKDNYKGVPILYALQTYDPKVRDRPWGTADATCAVKDVINCPFVLCNGDDIYGENSFKILVEHLKNENIDASIGYRIYDNVPEKGTVNRAVFQTDKEGFVKEINEVIGIERDKLHEKNLKPDDFCSMNQWAFHPETVKLLCSEVENFKKIHNNDRKIECFLPDELSKFIKQKKIKVKVCPCNESTIGITNPGDELIVREKLKELES